MASRKADTNPFNADGRSGAIGNQSGGENGAPFAGIRNNVPPSLKQKHGSLRNPQSISEGGPFLRLDPPSDRESQVSTFAKGDARQRLPFRLDGGASSDDEGEVGTADGPGAVGNLEGPDPETPAD